MIFDYTDYRTFLKIYVRQLSTGARGEVARMATAVGIYPTLLSQVFSQKKHLTLDMALKVAEYVCLNELETEYFLALIQFERSNDKSVQKYWKKKIDYFKNENLKLKNRISHESKALTDPERAVYYSSYVYTCVRQYLLTGEKGRSLNEICERFNLPRIRAAQIMKQMLDFQLISEENGLFKIVNNSTYIEKGSPHLLKHFVNWRLKAIQQHEDLSDNELMFTAVVSLSRDDFNRLREEMAQFIKKFFDTVHASPAEDVATINLDWFWVK